MITTKQCSICNEVKPITEFHKRNSGSTDGHRRECKECRHHAYAVKKFYDEREKERQSVVEPEPEVKFADVVEIITEYEVPLWMKLVEWSTFFILACAVGYVLMGGLQ